MYTLLLLSPCGSLRALYLNIDHECKMVSFCKSILYAFVICPSSTIFGL